MKSTLCTYELVIAGPAYSVVPRTCPLLTDSKIVTSGREVIKLPGGQTKTAILYVMDVTSAMKEINKGNIGTTRLNNWGRRVIKSLNRKLDRSLKTTTRRYGV